MLSGFLRSIFLGNGWNLSLPAARILYFFSFLRNFVHLFIPIFNFAHLSFLFQFCSSFPLPFLLLFCSGSFLHHQVSKPKQQPKTTKKFYKVLDDNGFSMLNHEEIPLREVVCPQRCLQPLRWLEIVLFCENKCSPVNSKRFFGPNFSVHLKCFLRIDVLRFHEPVWLVRSYLQNRNKTKQRKNKPKSPTKTHLD